MPLYGFSCGEGHRFERMVPLARFHEAQRCECGAVAEREIAAPHVISDAIAPVMGGDGRLHDSRAAYHRSLTPEGNPRGERFEILGAGESIKPTVQKRDQKALRDDIARSIAEVKQGRRVEPVAIEGV